MIAKFSRLGKNYDENERLTENTDITHLCIYLCIYLYVYAFIAG